MSLFYIIPGNMFDFNISQVVGLLGLEVKGNIEGHSYNVRCPHCGIIQKILSIV